MGRKAYWVSLRQPGRRNIYVDIVATRLFFALSGTGQRARQKDTAMLKSEIRTIGSFIKQLIPVFAITLIMAPFVSYAEPLLLLHYEVSSYPVPEITRQVVKRPVDFSLNENGDLVIRHRDVSFTMAYSPPDEVIKPQERIRIAQRQDCPSISGISLKISFLF